MNNEYEIKFNMLIDFLSTKVSSNENLYVDEIENLLSIFGYEVVYHKDEVEE